MIDSLEQTWLYMHGDKDEVKRKTVCENLEQILKQVDIFLESFGVKGFKVVGEEFDPHRHEALGALETSRHEEGIVLDVLQRGYMLKDRLLRPAAVLISKKK